MIPLWDTRIAGTPIWVITIIALNIFVFFLELTSPSTEVFISQYALIPAAVNFSDFHTLVPFITSQFVHGGFLHIISNMWFLWIFGDNVEEKLGFLLFPLFYLGSGIIGNFLQYIFVSNSAIPMLGASGAIAGVLGAYYALFPRNKIKSLLFILFFVTIIDVPASLVLLYWFALQLFSGVLSASVASGDGGVAYFAHIGGFVTGWLIGKLL